nr:protein MEI2-like 4 isoform X1 [Tanacetum cinerariifolium]GEY96322.1 protein MEI2-like 4 isoform X1 [Tanacetum cinerariifolium]
VVGDYFIKLLLIGDNVMFRRQLYGGVGLLICSRSFLVLTRSSRIGRSGFSGLHQTLICSSSFQDHHLNRVTWAQSPPVDNSVCAHNAPTTVSHKSFESDPGTASHHSFGKMKNRARRNNHDRHENSSCHADEKKYELDIERLLRREDCRTTMMIKHIPNKYSLTMLLAAITEHNQGTYNFIYLPLDFKLRETEIKGDDAYKEELLDYEEGDEKAPYVM